MYMQPPLDAKVLIIITNTFNAKHYSPAGYIKEFKTFPN